MLFGLVYTRTRPAAHDPSYDLFRDWHPELDFLAHWRFAGGGGMGVVEAASSAEIENALAPYRQFFEFTLTVVEPPVREPALAASAELVSVA